MNDFSCTFIYILKASTYEERQISSLSVTESRQHMPTPSEALTYASEKSDGYE